MTGASQVGPSVGSVGMMYDWLKGVEPTSLAASSRKLCCKVLIQHGPAPHIGAKDHVID